MGSGDPSGLQNRRELALLALVSSTLTRFRQTCSFLRLAMLAQDFGSRLRRREIASTSKPARVSFAGSGEFDSHTLPPKVVRSFGSLRSLRISPSHRQIVEVLKFHFPE
jgi:hypothetical protein